MKYMLLINSGAADEQGGAPQCTVEDWMAYDKEIRTPASSSPGSRWPTWSPRPPCRSRRPASGP